MIDELERLDDDDVEFDGYFYAVVDQDNNLIVDPDEFRPYITTDIKVAEYYLNKHKELGTIDYKIRKIDVMWNDNDDEYKFNRWVEYNMEDDITGKDITK